MQNRHQNSGFSLSRQTRQTPKRLSARLLATCVALAFSGAAAAHHAPGMVIMSTITDSRPVMCTSMVWVR